MTPLIAVAFLWPPLSVSGQASARGPSPTYFAPGNGTTLFTNSTHNGAPVAKFTIRANCPMYTTSYGTPKDFRDYFLLVSTSPNNFDPSLAPSKRVPIHYTVSSSLPFSNGCDFHVTRDGLRRGTYWWRLLAVDVDFPSRYNAGPIWQVTVASPPGPGPTPSSFLSKPRAITYLKREVRGRYRAKARLVSCARISSSRFSCSTVYRKRGSRFRLKMTVRHQVIGGDLYYFVAETSRRKVR